MTAEPLPPLPRDRELAKAAPQAELASGVSGHFGFLFLRLTSARVESRTGFAKQL